MHQQDKDKLEDTFFTKGTIRHIKAGNKGRYLDGRRTPGKIVEVSSQEGFFRWLITGFEDQGRTWEVDLEDIGNFQFDSHAQLLSGEEEKDLQQVIDRVNHDLSIPFSRQKFMKTQALIGDLSKAITAWIKAQGIEITLQAREEHFSLLEAYMKKIGCHELEEETANALVLNPRSGEWFKGILLTMADLGLVPYQGKMPRTKDIFTGIGAKELRRTYILHRMAFVQSFFHLAGQEKVTLYRGMSSEGHWEKRKRSILHMTFSAEVASSFASHISEKQYQTAYLVKMTLPVSRLFMTFYETRALNGRYQEEEALIIGDVDFTL